MSHSPKNAIPRKIRKMNEMDVTGIKAEVCIPEGVRKSVGETIVER
jgi:hypothetical protein